MVNSREKGARGERELAGVLRDYGYEARRGQQYAGANGDADVVGLPGIHIECKRVERLNLYDAIAQAKHDARDGETPCVFHRKDNCKWLVTMELDDWINMYNDTTIPDDWADKVNPRKPVKKARKK
jgi:Holliday junction resolvase